MADETQALREFLQGYRAAHVAKATGLTRQTVHDFINNRRAARPKTCRLLKAFVASQQVVARQVDTQ